LGAWGVGNFENDSALDWIQDFLDSPDKIKTLKNIIELANNRQGLFAKVFNRDSELEEPDASAVLVSCEIISVFLGKPSFDLQDDLKDWAINNQLKIDSTLVNNALRAISLVKNNSELKVLWEETNDFELWLKEVDNLETRLEKGISQ
jgi:hypothetical protein